MSFRFPPQRTISLLRRACVRRFGVTKAATGYRGLKPRQDRGEWTDLSADLTADSLKIDGHPVMEKWEAPFMDELAATATVNGGRVLEVGFGLGLSAAAIQRREGVTEHIVLEANSDVFLSLKTFAAAARAPVKAVGPGLWQDTLATVEDDSLDGILYDTYPLRAEEQHTHEFEFIQQARRVLKPGGVLTYCNLTSLGVLRGEFESWDALFAETQLPHLLAAGWDRDEVSFRVVDVEPDPECAYYQHGTALVPILTKRGGTRSDVCDI